MKEKQSKHDYAVRGSLSPLAESVEKSRFTASSTIEWFVANNHDKSQLSTHEKRFFYSIKAVESNQKLSNITIRAFKLALMG
jgi:hypothetical protein